MANKWYELGKQAVADGTIAWATHDMRVVLVKSTYTVDLVNHQYLSDIAAAARVATSSALTGKSLTRGVFDAADVVFAAVASGSTVTQFVVYRTTVVEATSPLMLNENSASNLPFVTDGSDINLIWDNGPSKVAAL